MTKFSLVVPTIGRDLEVIDLLSSLKEQDYKDFEVIFVDQNQDDRLVKIINGFKNDLDIKHFKVDFDGVSRARNFGIKHATGEYITFPDDDCVYSKSVLAEINDMFSENSKLSVISTACYDLSGKNFSIGDNRSKQVCMSPFMLLGIEFTMFFNMKNIVKEELYFNEQFGIKSKYCSNEGFELLYRLMRKKYVGYFTPHIKILHRNKNLEFNRERLYKYSIGIGAFIRKFLNQSDIYIIYFLVRKMIIGPVAKILTSMLKFRLKNIKKQIVVLRGLWNGFSTYNEI